MPLLARTTVVDIPGSGKRHQSRLEREVGRYGRPCACRITSRRLAVSVAHSDDEVRAWVAETLILSTETWPRRPSRSRAGS